MLYKGGDIYIKTWTIRNAENIDYFSDDIDEKFDVNAIRLYCGIPTFIEDDEEVFPLKVNIKYSQYLIKKAGEWTDGYDGNESKIGKVNENTILLHGGE